MIIYINSLSTALVFKRAIIASFILVLFAKLFYGASVTLNEVEKAA